jgi:hypothetical protein
MADGAASQPARSRPLGGRVVEASEFHRDGQGTTEPRDGREARRGASGPAPRAQRASTGGGLYAPLYREIGLNAPELAQARRAVEFILAQQEPYPAIALDRHWNMVMANAATHRFFTLFPECVMPQPPNVLKLIFDPQGLRPFVENWEDVASRVINRVHREVAGAPPDAGLRALLKELLGYPGVPQRWSTSDLERPLAPLLDVAYKRNELKLRFFSTITTFGTPQDVTLQELRIESFFPADDVTDRFSLQASRSDQSTSLPQR